MAKIKLFVLLAAFAVAGAFLAKVYLDAESPSSVKVTVYKVEFMTDRSDAQPQVVFSNAAGKDIDLITETGGFIGQARLTAGVYKRIRLTVKNGIKMSIANADSNPCAGAEQFTDRVFPLTEGTDLNSQVPIYFAADVDGGGAWMGSQITNLLIKPLTISQNRTTAVKLRFVVADTLFCPDGKVERRAPWSVWSETTL
ncbi:MAG TPA: DUF4382 domain-containing protein [Nitrospirota bacterium]|nr:DUF4382 domain-containing protein [Nitrospirota bacterium]